MTHPAGAIPPSQKEQGLCLACGMCCNGFLFKDVELQESDDPVQLRELGLPLRVRTSGKGPHKKNRATVKISTPQPCSGLLGRRCTLYADRPLRCRQFDCSLLLQLRNDTITEDQALRMIRSTLKAATKVKRLLHELGDTKEDRPLGLRFQRMRHQMESNDSITAEEAGVYADLTLAVHDFQHRLAKHFYP